MLKKLLNKKNLIIIAVVFLSLMMLPNVVFADNVSISSVLKETISAWYSIILYTCLAVMLVALIVLAIKALITQIASEKAVFKKLIVDWLIGMVMLLLLTQFIYALIYLNEAAVNKCKDLGNALSGIDAENSDDEYDEVTLYETAVTKAYEIKYSSGTVGMIMYIILVYFTIRFFLVYVKRYLNVMILILIGPIIVTIYSFRKILMGKGGLIGRWVKELIYNIFIQTIHAGAYATLIGLTIRMSDSLLSFIGAFLTLIIFMFIFEIDKLIRRIFNFVGGKSTVQVRDYAYFMKHPIENSKSQGRYWLSQAQAIPSKLQNELNPNAIKTKATSAMYDAKEAFQSLDAKQVEVSKEAIAKEKEKMAHPNALQKVFNKIQGLAYGAIGAGIGGIEKIAGKTKEQLDKLKSSIRKSKENLNQDVLMIKNLGKILKNHSKRKDLLEKAKNNEELTEEEARKATVVNAEETQEEEVQEIKEEIEDSGDDMIAVVEAVEGPQAFLYPEIGSTYMGISVLASSREEEMVLKEPEFEVEDEEEQDKTKQKSKRRLILPNFKKVGMQKQQSETQKEKTKFKFKRFNKKSVQTIVRSLNRRHILNKRYLTVMYRMSQRIENGEVLARGTAQPQENLEIEQTENVEVRTASVKYKADLSLDSGNVHETNMQVSAMNKKSRRLGVKDMKQKSSITMAKYQERVRDGKWAVYGAGVEDIKNSHETVVKRSVESVEKASSTQIAMQDMIDKGEGMMLNKDVAIVFSPQGMNSIVSNLPESKAKQAQSTQIEVGAVSEAQQILEQVVSEQEGKKAFRNRNEVTEQVLAARKTMVNQDGEVVNETEKVSFGAKSITELTEEIKNDKTEKSEIITIVNASLVNFAVKNDMPLNELNLAVDESAQDEIVDDLVEKGVISSEVKNDEIQRNEVIEALEERRKKFVSKEKKDYVESVLKKAIAETVVKTADAGDAVADKAGNIKDTVVNSAMVDNRFSKLLGEIAKDTVKVGVGVAAGTVATQVAIGKEMLVDEMVEHAKDFGKATVQEIKDGVEVYSPTEEEFIAKGNQIKESVEKAGESAKKTVINAVNPFSSGANKDKRRKSNDDKYDKDQTVQVWVKGYVNNPGIYEMKLGSRVYEAIKKAGGETPEGDASQMKNLYDYIPNEGGVIEVPKKNPEDVEKLYARCRPVVLKIVKEYMEEKEISDPNSLTKLIHMKTLTSKVQQALRDEDIKKEQIEELINECIKNEKTLQEMGQAVKDDMKIVNIENLELDETEEIKTSRQRQKQGAMYKNDQDLADALAKLKFSSEEVKDEEQQNTAQETVSDMKKLLEDLNAEKVYAVATPKEEARKKYLDMMGY